MTTPGDADPQEQSTGGEQLSREAIRIAATLRAMATDLGTLLGLEARLAGVTLAAMCALAVLTAGLVLSGWILLQIGAAWWLRNQGIEPAHTILAAGAGNLVLAAICWLVAVHRSRRLTFANTRAVLTRMYSHESTEQSR